MNKNVMNDLESYFYSNPKFNSRIPIYNDDSDYTTNAPSYYDDLARKNKLMKVLALRIWEYEEEMIRRLEQWDKNLEDFPDDVKKLLERWLEDGTLDHIINDTIFNWKADKTYVDDELDKKADQTYVDTELGKKANQTYVDTELGNVDTELGKKANQTYVDTITRVAPVNSSDISKGINDFYQTLNEGETIKFPNGEYDLYDPLIFDRNINIDFTGVTFNYYGVGFAITIGHENDTIEPGRIILPDLYKNGNVNWTMAVDGVRVLNVFNTIVYFGDVEKFRKGIVIDSINNNGNSYNDYYFKRVVNNLHSLVLTSDLQGWTNENTFNSGRFAMTSAMSDLVTEINTHVLIEYNDYSQNNNMFNNMSFESAVSDNDGHAVIIEDGRMIYFRDCRYEGVRKVKILAGTDIQFTEGFGMSALDFTDRQPRTVKSNLHYREARTFGFEFEATQSAENDIFIFKSANAIRAIIKGDGSIESNGSISFKKDLIWGGSGTGKPENSFTTGSESPINTVVAGPGSIYLDYSKGHLYTKTYGIHEAGWKLLQHTHNGTLTGRPSNVPIGYQYFDVTLNKPIWWNGTVWVDSQGTEIE